MTKLRPPRGPKLWRVEAHGGSQDGLTVDCASLHYALIWYQTLLDTLAREQKHQGIVSETKQDPRAV